jgi:hypothetical protein
MGQTKNKFTTCGPGKHRVMSIPVAARKRGFEAGRLLGLRIRNPPGARMFVSRECCVMQVEDSATGQSLIRGIPTEYVCMCVIDFDQVQK